MGKHTKVSLSEWELIKSHLRYLTPEGVVIKDKRHITTVVRVQASKNYEDYKDKVNKERQPRKPGKLREDVDDLISRVGKIETRLGMDKDGCEE